MSKYGVFIGGDNNIASDLSKLSICSFFTYYFGNPQMKRIKEANGMVLYGCRIPTHMAVNSKYIIASVETKNAPRGDTVTLDQIDWKSLQTRILDEKYSVPIHRYSEKTDNHSMSPIKVFDKSDSMYKYSCENMPGLVIALLFSKSQTRVYADTGNLRTAIETYNTVFTL
jgi:hypothetical protein